jgi:hypothetical protein
MKGRLVSAMGTARKCERAIHDEAVRQTAAALAEWLGHEGGVVASSGELAKFA